MTTPADNRRATSLVVHYGNEDFEGVNAIIAETIETKRITPLFVSILDLHQEIIPILLTEDGIACVNYMIYALTTDPEPDIAEAAQLITAHGQRDDDRFNELMRQAGTTGRLTNLLIGVLSVGRHVVPQLYCELGVKVLERCALDWAAREDSAG